MVAASTLLQPTSSLMQRAHLSSVVVLPPFTLFPQAKAKSADAAMANLGKYSGKQLKKIPVSTQKISLANTDSPTFDLAVEEATRVGYATSVKADSRNVLLSRDSCASGGRGRLVAVSMIVPGIGGDKDTCCVKGPLFKPRPHWPPPTLGKLSAPRRCRHNLRFALSQRFSAVIVWRCHAFLIMPALRSLLVPSMNSGQGGEAEFRNGQLGKDQADRYETGLRRRQHGGSSCGERATDHSAI